MRSSTVEQIKSRLSIIDVVGSYVKLHKAGKDYKGLSPFTKEKTPSFHVSPDRGVYYCFSTNKGGDMFTFIQELEGVDFKGALTILAERAGVDIVFEKPGEKDARERLYAALEESAKWYHEQLLHTAAADEYLRKRGVTEETRVSFRIGYAPEPAKGGWRPLTTHLEKAGYTRKELLDAGLAKLGRQNDLYDQFRSRIVFPLFDAAGRVIGFSGRLFPDDPEKKAPKYLNSPDTPLFHKSKFLYGYDRARGAIRKYNFSILVEGQMDIVLSHQAGFPNTVAVSGTALTAEHLALLQRQSDNLLLAFDSDPAGIRAGLKSASLGIRLGMEVKVAEMPLGKDPADLVNEDPALLKAAVKNAVHIVPFMLSLYRQALPDNRKFALAVRRDILPLLALIPNAIDREQWERVVATKLSVSEQAIKEELSKIAPPDTSSASPHRSAPQPGTKQPRSRKETLIRVLAARSALYAERKDTERINALHNEFMQNEGKRYYEEIQALVKGEHEVLLFEAGESSEDLSDIEILNSLEREVVKQQLVHNAAALRAAEAEGDFDASTRLQAACNDLTRRIAKLSKT